MYTCTVTVYTDYTWCGGDIVEKERRVKSDSIESLNMRIAVWMDEMCREEPWTYFKVGDIEFDLELASTLESINLMHAVAESWWSRPVNQNAPYPYCNCNS